MPYEVEEWQVVPILLNKYSNLEALISGSGSILSIRHLLLIVRADAIELDMKDIYIPRDANKLYRYSQKQWESQDPGFSRKNETHRRSGKYG